jgi:hypothetical protein
MPLWRQMLGAPCSDDNFMDLVHCLHNLPCLQELQVAAAEIGGLVVALLDALLATQTCTRLDLSSFHMVDCEVFKQMCQRLAKLQSPCPLTQRLTRLRLTRLRLTRLRLTCPLPEVPTA